jgi:hypothetical protein
MNHLAMIVEATFDPLRAAGDGFQMMLLINILHLVGTLSVRLDILSDGVGGIGGLQPLVRPK